MCGVLPAKSVLPTRVFRSTAGKAIVEECYRRRIALRATLSPRFQRGGPLVRSVMLKGVIMDVLGGILESCGALMVFCGAIWFLVVAFRENVWWGLGCLFINVLILVFLIKYFDKSNKPFGVLAIGLLLMFVGEKIW
jgi:hypothetical protein